MTADGAASGPDTTPESDPTSPMPPDGTARPVGPGEQQPVLVVMGVSGAGKSTIAALLARRLGWEFAEGDDLHPESNVRKMAAGIPLTDQDRAPWLRVVAGWIAQRSASGTPGIITCSALKQSYRTVLRGSPPRGARVVFVFLRVGRERLAARMAGRSGHFMPATLLDSQLNTLEEPTPGEDVLVVDGSGAPGAPDRLPAELTAEIIDRLGLLPRAH